MTSTPAPRLNTGAFSLELSVANPVEFSADPVTQDVLGFPVNVTAYEVGIGSAPGTYSRTVPAALDAGLIRAKVPALPAGTYYAAMRAFAGSVASAYSNEASFVIEQAPPKAPANFSVA